jgi:c-di-GMP-binding flagellar brake protein YcgR
MDRLLRRLEARLSEASSPPRRGKTARKVKPEDRRTHSRKAADLVIRYRWPGRHSPLIGRVRDISRGGVRFIASRQLTMGTMLQASLHAPGGPGPEFEGQMYLEVVHCRSRNDLWEIGARFAPMPLEKFRGTERRTARRFRVSLDVAYRLSGEEDSPPSRGRVRDISRGGVRFACDRRIRPGALAAAVISGRQPGETPGGGTRISVSALVKIVRCRKVGDRFEAGAQFVG